MGGHSFLRNSDRISSATLLWPQITTEINSLTTLLIFNETLRKPRKSTKPSFQFSPACYYGHIGASTSLLFHLPEMGSITVFTSLGLLQRSSEMCTEKCGDNVMTQSQKYDQLNWASGYATALLREGVTLSEIKERLLQEGIKPEAVDLLPKGLVTVEALIPPAEEHSAVIAI